MSIAMDVRRAIVKKCMAEGIESPSQIGMVTAQALMGIGKMSVAGYKAHATRKRIKAIRQNRFRR